MHHYQRELQVAIKSVKDGKRLFDVTVHNMSRHDVDAAGHAGAGA